jgi:hypothetical protein
VPSFSLAGASTWGWQPAVSIGESVISAQQVDFVSSITERHKKIYVPPQISLCRARETRTKLSNARNMSSPRIGNPFHPRNYFIVHGLHFNPLRRVVLNNVFSLVFRSDSDVRKVFMLAISQTHCPILNVAKISPFDMLPTAINSLL